MAHHYAIVAAKLVEQCLGQIQYVIDSSSSCSSTTTSRGWRRGSSVRGNSRRATSSSSSSSGATTTALYSYLYDMKAALVEIESFLLHYILGIIDKEVDNFVTTLSTTTIATTTSQHDDQQQQPQIIITTIMEQYHQLVDSCSSSSSSSSPSCDLRTYVDFLQCIIKETNAIATIHSGVVPHSYYVPRRSTTDSLLFRLNVALQLCLVRIDDAQSILCHRSSRLGRSSSSSGTSISNTVTATAQQLKQETTRNPFFSSTIVGCIGIGSSIVLFTTGVGARRSQQHRFLVLDWVQGLYPQGLIPNVFLSATTRAEYRSILSNTTKVILSLMTVRYLHQYWRHMWLTTKLVKSTDEMEEWIRQWMIIQSVPAPTTISLSSSRLSSMNWDHNTTSNAPTDPFASPSMSQQQALVPQTLPPTTIAAAATGNNQSVLLDAARSRRLIEYAMQETVKHSFWHSQGELRFLMVKRAMDVLYASVGTAIDWTGGDMNTTTNHNTDKNHHSQINPTSSNSNTNKKQNDAMKQIQLTLVTAAVASYYSVIGAREKAASVTSSSESASYLIRNAWGMVSLPAVKNLSLQASRLIKGAAVADRVEICGVPCFILSSDPAPELAAAIKRSHRLLQQNQLRSRRSRLRKPIATLSTIDEQEEHLPPCRHYRHRNGLNGTPFVRSSSRRYRQRDVIFHLTGGGFFAHIHSTDLPYLIDWSAATGAVVICPEYALLPEHTFPVALNQVEEVYEALVSDEAVSVLGFETNRIIVTGESAGGNLAASLCVKIISANMTSVDNEFEASTLSLPLSPNQSKAADDSNHFQLIPSNDDDLSLGSSTNSPMQSPCQRSTNDEGGYKIRLPDALMLSCPVLNLSLEMSHSRVIGNDDPVLPSGLISAISDAYLPAKLGISKKDPLASPFYASNDVLRHFPRTLLFASSNDPLLDDSVVFNQRLCELCGVEQCDLIAAHNLPHAYLGLGTAGFPEAQQIQEQCMIWLNEQFHERS